MGAELSRVGMITLSWLCPHIHALGARKLEDDHVPLGGSAGERSSAASDLTRWVPRGRGGAVASQATHEAKSPAPVARLPESEHVPRHPPRRGYTTSISGCCRQTRRSQPQSRRRAL